MRRTPKTGVVKKLSYEKKGWEGSEYDKPLTIAGLETVRHICFVYEYILANGATSRIPTFYDYLGLSYADLEGQPDKKVRREVWKAVQQQIAPTVADWQESSHATRVDNGAYTTKSFDPSYEHLNEDIPPPRARIRALLSDDDIKRAVAEVLIRDNMRHVYDKFMMAQMAAIDGRKRLLETSCYEGWGERNYVEE